MAARKCICMYVPYLRLDYRVAWWSEYLRVFILPNHDMLRPDHNTGNSVRYSFPTGRAFFYVLQARESNHLQMQLQRQHFLLNYLKIWVLVQRQRQLPDPSATGVIQGLFHWRHILWLRLLSCYCTSGQDVLPDLTRALFMVRGSNELGIFGCQLLL